MQKNGFLFYCLPPLMQSNYALADQAGEKRIELSSIR